MDSNRIKLFGTVVLPEYNGRLSLANALEQSGIKASNLVQLMLFKETDFYLPEKKVNCFKAITEIKNLDLATVLGDDLVPLNPIDIWRIFQLNATESEIKFNDKGACNTVLVSSGAAVIWHAQLAKSRHEGWKASLYTQASVFYGEFIFSGCV